MLSKMKMQNIRRINVLLIALGFCLCLTGASSKGGSLIYPIIKDPLDFLKGRNRQEIARIKINTQTDDNFNESTTNRKQISLQRQWWIFF